MQTSFKQIRPDKDIVDRDGSVAIMIFAFISVGLIVFLIKVVDLHPLLIFFIVLPILLFGKSATRKYYGDWAKQTDIVGQLIFDLDFIQWMNNGTEETLPVSNIQKLKLRYNYIQGDSFGYKDITHNGLAQIEIHIDSCLPIHIKFLIVTTDELNNLIPIWKEYYKRGIIVKEYMGKYEFRTILFKSDIMPSGKMQELKKELNVENFYV
ncbi:hypothetical protein [uncultured Cytophaga sp.]|uniref:hypothetical protein n=1 Tax=uncultured Cytophaga sp. TaxID=160238 RepID=UPI0026325AB6|nr:hypothetical protein [uncultured Cytophaga sp.]